MLAGLAFNGSIQSNFPVREYTTKNLIDNFVFHTFLEIGMILTFLSMVCCLPTCLFAYLPTYLLAACLLAYLLVCLLAYLLTCLFTCLLTCLLAYLPACLFVCLLVWDISRDAELS